jgi:acetylornithine/N-succinyldiaminopimelate aminotransferase
VSSLYQREADAFFHTYKRIPLEIDHGKGLYLYTKDGSRYLDMFSGLAVNPLGYGHPGILKAIQEQAARYIHVSNYYLQEPQIRLAELLLKHTGYVRAFFSNSGTEATEGAIKIARQWGIKKEKSEIISFTNAFHGRTYGALSLMDRPKYKDGFGPFLSGFRSVAFNDVGGLSRAVSETTATVILECIQGEGGVRPISQEFADRLTALKEQFGFLLIADEIQSGLGRTGKFFGYEHFGLHPDIVLMAKPIGGGLPLGVILGNSAVADVLQPGMHGTTFGGNPVACAAGVAVLQEVVEKGLIKNADTMGALMKSMLEDLARKFPGLIKEVRGCGLMLAAELDRDCEPVVAAMRDRYILINGTDRTVLRFLPPLIVREEHVRTTIEALRDVLDGMR